MGYFNHAFKKAFYGTEAKLLSSDGSQTANEIKEFGILDETYTFVNPAASPAPATLDSDKDGFYICMASWYSYDKLGDGTSPHGGYKESSKSKMIKAKYINDMWITRCTDEVPNKFEVTIKATGAGTSCFPCGSDPIMRVDVKGAAALRLLNHNAYQMLSGSLPMPVAGATITSKSGVDMCCVTQTSSNIGIAPSIVAINFRDQFNNDPIMSKLGTCKLQWRDTAASPSTFADVNTTKENFIYNGGAAGVNQDITGLGNGNWASETEYKIVFEMKTSCELQTIFGCSFDTRDNYLMGDLKVMADLVDEAGNPCVACQAYVTGVETAEFKQRNISTETVKRDLIMTESYRQSPFHQGARDSVRMREIEETDAIPTEIGKDATTGTCAGKFAAYHILHSVPRFNNPSGVFDNDQYHYVIYMPCNGDHGVDSNTNWNNSFKTIAALWGGAGAAPTIDQLIARGGIKV